MIDVFIRTIDILKFLFSEIKKIWVEKNCRNLAISIIFFLSTFFISYIFLNLLKNKTEIEFIIINLLLKYIKYLSIFGFLCSYATRKTLVTNNASNNIIKCTLTVLWFMFIIFLFPGAVIYNIVDNVVTPLSENMNVLIAKVTFFFLNGFFLMIIFIFAPRILDGIYVIVDCFFSISDKIKNNNAIMT